MFTDTYRLIHLGIAEAHRQADLERSFRRGRVAAAAAAETSRESRPGSAPAVSASVAAPVAAPDAALIAAGERSDALLTPACGPCQTADRAA
jgi:hypothetical protein